MTDTKTLNKNMITTPLDEGYESEKTEDGESSLIINGNISMSTYKHYKKIKIGNKLIIVYDNSDLFDVIPDNKNSEKKIDELRAKHNEYIKLFR